MIAGKLLQSKTVLSAAPRRWERQFGKLGSGFLGSLALPVVTGSTEA